MSYLKIGGIVVGIIALLWAINTVSEWREASIQLPLERARHAAEVDRLNDRIIKEIDNAKKANSASAEYQQRLADLERARAATPTRTVRLCVEQVAPARLPVSAAASGPDDAGPVELPDNAGSNLGVGRDIGPELYALADAADRCAAQRDGLIKWIRNR